MKARTVGCTVFVLVAAISFQATAQRKAEQTVRGSMIVSTNWLAQHLKDDSLILFQIGEKKEYAEGHIPGAQFLSLDDISAPRGEGRARYAPARNCQANFSSPRRTACAARRKRSHRTSR